MLVFLFSLLEYVEFGESNFDSTLDTHKVLCVKVWNTFCPHSAAFAPTWEEFIKLHKDDTDVEYGSIECHANQNLCDKLVKGLFPQVIWFEKAAGLQLKFSGNRTIPNLNKFVETMKNYPFNSENIENYQSIASESKQVYELVLPSTEKSNIIQYRKIFNDVGLTNEQVFLKYSDSNDFSLNVYNPSQTKYEGKLNTIEIANFVQESSLQPANQFSENIYNMFKNTGKSFVYVCFDTKAKLNAFLPSFQRKLKKYKTIYELYSVSAILPQIIAPNEKNIVALFNPQQSTVYRLKKAKPTYKDIENFIESIERGQFYLKSMDAGSWGAFMYLTLICGICIVVLIVRLLHRKFPFFLKKRNQPLAKMMMV